MHSDRYRYLNFISFKDISQWYVEYYLNDNEIHSKYSLIPLRKLIMPKKDVIKKEDYDGIIPIVEKIVFKTGKVVFREKKATGMNLYALQQNDLLVSNINFHQGATALNTFGSIVASTHYQPYIINTDFVRPDFLTMVLRSPTFLRVVSRKKAQGIKNESGYNFIGSFSFPLPQLKEQKEIVSQYNEKIQEAENIEQIILQIERNVNTYLLDVLKVSNKLCDKKSKRNYDFLHFYKLKRMSRWDLYNEKATSNSELYKNVKLSDIILSRPQYGAGFSSKSFDGNIRYIRITDINEDGSLNDDKVSANDFSERYVLKKNDFLIARSGNTVGKTFLYKEDIGKAIYAGYLIRFELDTTQILPDYLLAFTKCSIYKDWIKGNMRVSAQPNINSQQYLDSPVIMPPMDVQKEIVAHIEEQKALAKQLKQKTKEIRENALKEFENEIFDNYPCGANDLI